MKAIILAAGEGKRMHPLTLTTPKPLLRYQGKAQLDHLAESLPEEITELIIATKYLGEQIRAYCGAQFHGRSVEYVVGSLEGNAVGLFNAESFLKNGERFVLIYGDEIVSKKEVEDCIAEEFAWLCLETKRDLRVGGVAIIEGEYVAGVVEKPEDPPSKFVANGVMVINTDIFKYKNQFTEREKGELFVSRLVDLFCKDHKVKAIFGPDHSQLTTPEDLATLDSIQ